MFKNKVNTITALDNALAEKRPNPNSSVLQALP